MMDGQVAAIRQALDRAGHTDTGILAYTAKYTSAFYGPFRQAVESQLRGDRKTYQQDGANVREALRELALDLEEGADMVMVKPAMAYLDVLRAVAEVADVPVAAYQVSGEYAMIEAAAANGWIERDRAVLETLTERLRYIEQNLIADADRPQFQAWVRELLRPAMQEVGWNTQAGETDDRKLFRATLFLTLGETGGDPDVQARARDLVERYLRGSDAVEPSLIGAAFKVAAINGDADFQQRLIAQLRKARTPEDTVRYRYALVKFRNPDLLRRVLELAMSPEIRSQDTPRYFSGVMENPSGRQVAWEYIKQNLPAIEEKLGYAVTRVVSGISAFCDASLRDDVAQFFERQKLPVAERRLKQSLELANYCVDLKTQQQPRLAAWLKQHNAVGGE
jgi:aminopeptidase N